MIAGIGIDLIEVGRVATRVSRGQAFKQKVFTEAEIAYCERQAYPEQHFAARFAAKEAFFKALGTGWSGTMQFTEIEVWLSENGQPVLKLHGSCQQEAQSRAITSMHLSMTHLKTTAAAVVILEC